MGDVVRKDEVSAALEARRELGPAYEDEVVDAVVARIEGRLAACAGADEKSLKRRRDHQKEMILGSLGISIPLFAIAAIFGGLAGIMVVAALLAVIALVSLRST